MSTSGTSLRQQLCQQIQEQNARAGVRRWTLATDRHNGPHMRDLGIVVAQAGQLWELHGMKAVTLLDSGYGTKGRRSLDGTTVVAWLEGGKVRLGILSSPNGVVHDPAWEKTLQDLRTSGLLPRFLDRHSFGRLVAEVHREGEGVGPGGRRFGLWCSSFSELLERLALAESVVIGPDGVIEQAEVRAWVERDFSWLHEVQLLTYKSLDGEYADFKLVARRNGDEVEVRKVRKEDGIDVDVEDDDNDLAFSWMPCILTPSSYQQMQEEAGILSEEPFISTCRVTWRVDSIEEIESLLSDRGRPKVFSDPLLP